MLTYIITVIVFWGTGCIFHLEAKQGAGFLLGQTPLCFGERQVSNHQVMKIETRLSRKLHTSCSFINAIGVNRLGRRQSSHRGKSNEGRSEEHGCCFCGGEEVGGTVRGLENDMRA
jgi:hypothetical protein